MTAQSVLAVSILVGRLVTGSLIEHFRAPAIAAVVILLAALGAIILAISGDSVATAGLGLFLFSLAQSSEIDLLSYLTARYFGLVSERYGAVGRWQSRCLARPAVQRGMNVLEQRIAKAVQELKDAGKWEMNDSPR